jgi:sarcosine oxidase
MADQHDVAVVGAGLLGLAAARAVAAGGRDVVVLERAQEIGHQGSGSKGSCRIFRLGYPDPDYVAAARQAGAMWRQLEAESGRQILLPTPQLTFGPEMAAVHAAMQQAGAPCELLSAAEAAERFPGVLAAGLVLLETESCVIAADQALAALAAAVPRIRTGVHVSGLADDGRRVTLSTSAGKVTARAAILTAGPGTAALLAGQLDVPTQPTLEQVGYLEPNGRFGSQAPIFLCYGQQTPYGLPVPGSELYKVGIHPSGPPVHPDSADQSPDPALVARIAEAAERYLPGYRPEPVSTERCVYDNTPDEHPVLDRVANVVIGCGTSGHGFKFGPLFGEWLASLAIGATESAPPDRFSLARLARPAAP